jgi:hypothetical protein
MPVPKMQIFTLPVVDIFYRYPLDMSQLSSLHLAQMVILFDKKWSFFIASENNAVIYVWVLVNCNVVFFF